MSTLAPADLSALIQVQKSSAAMTRSVARSTQQGNSDPNETEAREAAEKFEALLLHNMLKSMRKTTLSEDTSNARAIYDDMYDKQLADTMMEAGGLGIADQLMGQLLGNSSTTAAVKPAESLETSAVNTQASTQAQAGSTSTQDRIRLRELAQSMNERVAALAQSSNQTANQTASQSTRQGPSTPAVPSAQSSSGQHTDSSDEVRDIGTGLTRLQFLSRLWSGPDNSGSSLARSRTEFLQSLVPHAQRTAQRLGTSTNAVLAIAALETGWGKSMLKHENGESANNYFGIKATPGDRNATSNITTEYLNGKSQKVQSRFKSYDSTADSVDGFANFLLENPRYSTALQHASNPERFLRELHQAGYATDPRYAEKAITVMRQVEQHNSQP